MPIVNNLYSETLKWHQIHNILIISHLLNPERPRDRSLKKTWDKTLDIEKKERSNWSQFSEGILLYYIQDIKLLVKRENALQSRLKQSSLD